MAPFSLQSAAILAVVVMAFSNKLATCSGNPPLKTSLWRKMAALPHPVTPPSVTAAMMMTSSASRLQCVARCVSYGVRDGKEACVGVLYGGTGRVCYLFSRLDSTTTTTTTTGVPSVSALGKESQGLELIVNEANLCQTIEAKQHADNGFVGVIKHTSVTSLEANVTCDDDFMPTTDVFMVTCRDGQWSKLQGTCLQRIWRNGTVKVDINYRIPRTPVPGWSACATAVMSGKPERWIFNLRANKEDNLLNFDTRYSFKHYTNITYLNHRIGGVVARTKTNRLAVSGQDYPFQPDQTFRLTVRANASSEVHVLVDGKFYTNYSMPLPLTNLTFVNFKYQVQVLYLDLWCSSP